MTMLLMVPIGAVAGAFGRRIAGGVLSQWVGADVGTQTQRLAWGLLMTVVAALAAPSAWIGQRGWVPLAVALGIWTGSCCFGFAVPGCPDTGLRCGRAPGTVSPVVSARQWLYDQAALLWHGLGGVLLVALLAWWLGGAWWWLAIAGVACGPCYEVAYRWPLHAAWLGCHWYDPPPTAELVWGALVGIGVALAFAVG